MKKAGLVIFPLTLSLSWSAQVLVVVETNLGDIPIRLFDEEAPETVSNFLGYVERGDYQNVIFHRHVSNFILQTGGFRATEPPQVSLIEAVETQPPVQNEPGIPNTRGTVAMAKLGGDPDSATSQWFVNLADNSAILDGQNGGFTVFGEVLDMTTVTGITSQPVVNAGGDAFTTLPLTDGADPVRREEFIRITNVSVIPESSTASLLCALAAFSFVRRRSLF
ncbi:MAG: peptidylprolyl isomerase [Akkermansiaceae bacterium]